MPNVDENLDPMAQVGTAPEPVDLAQAFKMLNQTNREAAEEPVQDEEESGRNIEASNEESPSESTEYDDSDGGSSDGIDAIDFNAYKQGILRDIQRNAQSQIRKEFNEQNIGYYSMAELTVRDEDTGRVMFRNPDVQDERDPNYYFKSRTELQQFVEAWNKGVDYEFRKAVNEKQGELLQQAAPVARLIDFVPKWQAMDPTTRVIFDELLEGHEIRDNNGKEIGFNVNLDTVAMQAYKIAKRFPQQQQQTTAQQQQTKQSSGPALDMKTGNGKSEDEREPTNIGEALKMYDKKNRGGK